MPVNTAQDTGMFAPYGSFTNAAQVVPSDTQDLPNVAHGLYVGGAGNLQVNLKGTGQKVMFTGVPAGTILPIVVSAVFASGTTASNLVALW